MILLVIALIASGVISFFDIQTSLGKHESRSIVRGKDGRIDIKQYMIYQAIWTGFFVIVPLLMHYPLWVAGVCQLPNIAWKTYAVIHNSKVKA